MNAATMVRASPLDREGATMAETPAGRVEAAAAAMPEWVKWVSAGAGAALTYHGYRRTGSIGWAIVWGLLGSFAFPIAVPVALAQGFGQPAKRANPEGRRRRRRRR